MPRVLSLPSATAQKYRDMSTDIDDYLAAGHTEQQATLEVRRARKARSEYEDALLFRVELRTLSQPSIWRELRVPANTTFDKFHKILQIAFDWRNECSYKFEVQAKQKFDESGDYLGEALITISNSGYIAEARDLGNVGLLLTSSAKMTRVFANDDVDLTGVDCDYEYDFGNGWEHDIQFLGHAIPDHDAEVLKNGVALGQANFCIDGEGHSIAEDCGGECEWERTKWSLCMSGELDPWHFDIIWANRRLDHMWHEIHLLHNMMQPGQLENEIWYSDIWGTQRGFGMRESRVRLEAIAQDPEQIELYRRH
ncbi:hypothetical protein LTR56_023426 [Elasticomyces elasticus]|nr:hypothetical protein LTR56_023426 [Elasticomyces elasticus]KAK3625573.1 hypothetical protein LTR22_023504 [Elasticomyces elasticus]KAK4906716.1 hypothetical protein LTR49_024175 [Elasticomyces elasticus]KAK5746499.1 hypothetical protein LTS12_022734 [Elasticomyces elasticus]